MAKLDDSTASRAGAMSGAKLYVVLTYEGEANQLCIEALGPETVKGMIADVLSGVYTSENGKQVAKVEVGTKLEGGFMLPPIPPMSIGV